MGQLELTDVVNGTKFISPGISFPYLGRGIGARPMRAKGVRDRKAKGRDQVAWGLGRVGFPGKVRTLKQMGPFSRPPQLCPPCQEGLKHAHDEWCLFPRSLSNLMQQRSDFSVLKNDLINALKM